MMPLESDAEAAERMSLTERNEYKSHFTLIILKNKTFQTYERCNRFVFAAINNVMNQR